MRAAKIVNIFFTNGLVWPCICTCIFFMTACSNNKDTPINCIANYVKNNTNKEDLDDFIKLEGIEIWEKWGDLTADFAQNYSEIEKCGIYEYMFNNQTPMNTFRGKVTFVYLVHNYLKNGYIDQKQVSLEVEKVINN